MNFPQIPCYSFKNFIPPLIKAFLIFWIANSKGLVKHSLFSFQTKNSFSLRLIASLLTLSLLLTPQTGWGFSTSQPPSTPQISKVLELLPKAFGSIEEAWVSPFSSKNYVWIIQDPHGQTDGQKNIKRILDFLDEHKQIEGLYLEGARESLNVGLVKQFDSELLFNEGEIGGAELFLLHRQNSPHSIPLRAEGVETSSLYLKNLKLFQEIINQSSTKDAFLNKELTTLLTQGSLNFKPADHYFLKSFLQNEMSENSFRKNIHLLLLKAQQTPDLPWNQSDKQFRWPMLTRYEELSSREHSIHNNRAALEKKSLEKWTKKNGAQSLESIKNTDLRKKWERFYEANLSLGLQLENYPELLQIEGAKILESEIDASLLHSEFENIRREIFETLAKTRSQKAILIKYENYRLIQRLLNLELTRDEYDQLLSRKAPSCFSKSKLVTNALTFYQLAVKRDHAMTANFLADTVKQSIKKSVLIAGGFHSKGFKKELQEHNISYAVISPKLSALEDKAFYVRSLTGKTPAVKHFSHLRQPTILNPWTENEIGPDLGSRRTSLLTEASRNVNLPSRSELRTPSRQEFKRSPAPKKSKLEKDQEEAFSNMRKHFAMTLGLVSAGFAALHLIANQSMEWTFEEYGSLTVGHVLRVIEIGYGILAGPLTLYYLWDTYVEHQSVKALPEYLELNGLGGQLHTKLEGALKHERNLTQERLDTIVEEIRNEFKKKISRVAEPYTSLGRFSAQDAIGYLQQNFDKGVKYILKKNRKKVKKQERTIPTPATTTSANQPIKVLPKPKTGRSDPKLRPAPKTPPAAPRAKPTGVREAVPTDKPKTVPENPGTSTDASTPSVSSEPTNAAIIPAQTYERLVIALLLQLQTKINTFKNPEDVFLADSVISLQENIKSNMNPSEQQEVLDKLTSGLNRIAFSIWHARHEKERARIAIVKSDHGKINPLIQAIGRAENAAKGGNKSAKIFYNRLLLGVNDKTLPFSLRTKIISSYADFLFRNQQMDQAIKILQQGIALDPWNPYLQTQLAWVYIRRDENDSELRQTHLKAAQEKAAFVHTHAPFRWATAAALLTTFVRLQEVEKAEAFILGLEKNPKNYSGLPSHANQLRRLKRDLQQLKNKPAAAEVAESVKPPISGPVTNPVVESSAKTAPTSETPVVNPSSEQDPASANAEPSAENSTAEQLLPPVELADAAIEVEPGPPPIASASPGDANAPAKKEISPALIPQDSQEWLKAKKDGLNLIESAFKKLEQELRITAQQGKIKPGTVKNHPSVISFLGELDDYKRGYITGADQWHVHLENLIEELQPIIHEKAVSYLLTTLHNSRGKFGNPEDVEQDPTVTTLREQIDQNIKNEEFKQQLSEKLKDGLDEIAYTVWDLRDERERGQIDTARQVEGAPTHQLIMDIGSASNERYAPSVRLAKYNALVVRTKELPFNLRSRAQMGRAKVLIELGRFDDAISLLQEALFHDPWNYKLSVFLAKTFLTRTQLLPAEERNSKNWQNDIQQARKITDSVTRVLNNWPARNLTNEINLEFFYFTAWQGIEDGAITEERQLESHPAKQDFFRFLSASGATAIVSKSWVNQSSYIHRLLISKLENKKRAKEEEAKEREKATADKREKEEEMIRKRSSQSLEKSFKELVIEVREAAAKLEIEKDKVNEHPSIRSFQSRLQEEKGQVDAILWDSKIETFAAETNTFIHNLLNRKEIAFDQIFSWNLDLENLFLILKDKHPEIAQSLQLERMQKARNLAEKLSARILLSQLYDVSGHPDLALEILFSALSRLPPQKNKNVLEAERKIRLAVGNLLIKDYDEEIQIDVSSVISKFIDGNPVKIIDAFPNWKDDREMSDLRAKILSRYSQPSVSPHEELEINEPESLDHKKAVTHIYQLKAAYRYLKTNFSTSDGLANHFTKLKESNSPKESVEAEIEEINRILTVWVQDIAHYFELSERNTLILHQRSQALLNAKLKEIFPSSNATSSEALPQQEDSAFDKQINLAHKNPVAGIDFVKEYLKQAHATNVSSEKNQLLQKALKLLKVSAQIVSDSETAKYPDHNQAEYLWVYAQCLEESEEITLAIEKATQAILIINRTSAQDRHKLKALEWEAWLLKHNPENAFLKDLSRLRKIEQNNTFLSNENSDSESWEKIWDDLTAISEQRPLLSERIIFAKKRLLAEFIKQHSTEVPEPTLSSMVASLISRDPGSKHLRGAAEKETKKSYQPKRAALPAETPSRDKTPPTISSPTYKIFSIDSEKDLANKLNEDLKNKERKSQFVASLTNEELGFLEVIHSLFIQLTAAEISDDVASFNDYRSLSEYLLEFLNRSLAFLDSNDGIRFSNPDFYQFFHLSVSLSKITLQKLRGPKNERYFSLPHNLSAYNILRDYSPDYAAPQIQEEWFSLIKAPRISFSLEREIIIAKQITESHLLNENAEPSNNSLTNTEKKFYNLAINFLYELRIISNLKTSLENQDLELWELPVEEREELWGKAFDIVKSIEKLASDTSSNSAFESFQAEVIALTTIIIKKLQGPKHIDQFAQPRVRHAMSALTKLYPKYKLPEYERAASDFSQKEPLSRPASAQLKPRVVFDITPEKDLALRLQRDLLNEQSSSILFTTDPSDAEKTFLASILQVLATISASPLEGDAVDSEEHKKLWLSIDHYLSQDRVLFGRSKFAERANKRFYHFKSLVSSLSRIVRQKLKGPKYQNELLGSSLIGNVVNIRRFYPRYAVPQIPMNLLLKTEKIKRIPSIKNEIGIASKLYDAHTEQGLPYSDALFTSGGLKRYHSNLTFLKNIIAVSLLHLPNEDNSSWQIPQKNYRQIWRATHFSIHPLKEPFLNSQADENPITNEDLEKLDLLVIALRRILHRKLPYDASSRNHASGEINNSLEILHAYDPSYTLITDSPSSTLDPESRSELRKNPFQDGNKKSIANISRLLTNGILPLGQTHLSRDGSYPHNLLSFSEQQKLLSEVASFQLDETAAIIPSQLLLLLTPKNRKEWLSLWAESLSTLNANGTPLLYFVGPNTKTLEQEIQNYSPGAKRFHRNGFVPFSSLVRTFPSLNSAMNRLPKGVGFSISSVDSGALPPKSPAFYIQESELKKLGQTALFIYLNRLAKIQLISAGNAKTSKADVLDQKSIRQLTQKLLLEMGVLHQVTHRGWIAPSTAALANNLDLFIKSHLRTAVSA